MTYDRFILLTKDGRFIKKPHRVTPNDYATDDISRAHLLSDVKHAELAQASYRGAYGVETTIIPATATVLLDLGSLQYDDDSVITAVACRFSRILHSWLGPSVISAINAANEAGDNCASHDYCDPNEAMIQAFEGVVGREICFQDEDDRRIVDNAWNEARANGFSVKPKE